MKIIACEVNLEAFSAWKVFCAVTTGLKPP